MKNNGSEKNAVFLKKFSTFSGKSRPAASFTLYLHQETPYEIRRQIAHYEDKIQYERSHIREQEKKLDTLTSLGSKLGSLQNEFELKQAARRIKVALMAVWTGKCRVAKAYYDGMSGLLSGSDYKHALPALVRPSIGSSRRKTCVTASSPSTTGTSLVTGI